MVTCIEHRRRANYLPLLAAIHGVTGLREVRGTPKSDLHENEARIVQHDQVNFATATSKIARYRSQSLPDKIVKCRVFSAVA